MGALWPRQESREGPSLGMAREPSGLERWLKKAPPESAISMVKLVRTSPIAMQGEIMN